MSRSVFERVRERDSGTCRGCGTSRSIEVHHIVYRSHGGPDEEWNLISLCQRCHGSAHGLDKALKLPAWMLLWAVRVNYEGPLRLLAERVRGKCFSCEFQDDQKMCVVHEWQEAPDSYGCGSWVRRI